MKHLRNSNIVLLLIFCILFGFYTPLKANRELVTPPPVERTKPKSKKVKRKWRCGIHKAKIEQRRKRKIEQTHFRIKDLNQVNVFSSPPYLTVFFILLGLTLLTGILWLLGIFLGPALLLTIGIFATLILGSITLLYGIILGGYFLIKTTDDGIFISLIAPFAIAMILLAMIGMFWGIAALFGTFMLATIGMWLFLGFGILAFVLGLAALLIVARLYN